VNMGPGVATYWLPVVEYTPVECQSFR